MTAPPHPLPDDWNFDDCMAQSFGIWREDDHGVALRVRFRAGGLREIAEHLFTWGGDVRIEAPEELRKVMRERVMLAWASV